MKKLYHKFDKLMRLGRFENVVAIALTGAVIAGCSTTAPQQATHNWTATDNRLAKTFRVHNRECAENLYSVTDYETCMTERGYVLKLSQR